MKYQKDYQNKQNTAHKSNIKPHTHTGVPFLLHLSSKLLKTREPRVDQEDGAGH